MASFPITPRNRIRRYPRRARYDRATIYAILDASFLAHVAYVRDGRPALVPMLYARRGDALLIHGSPKSGLMQHLAAGGEVAVAVTLLDALVVTKAVADLSVNYRSVVAFGRGRLLPDEEKLAALRVLTERIVPGHWRDDNAPRPQDLAAVAVAEIPIELASAKVRDMPPDDRPAFRDAAVWAGLIPIRTVFGPPQAALYTGVPQPPEALRQRYELP